MCNYSHRIKLDIPTIPFQSESRETKLPHCTHWSQEYTEVNGLRCVINVWGKERIHCVEFKSVSILFGKHKEQTPLKIKRVGDQDKIVLSTEGTTEKTA